MFSLVHTFLLLYLTGSRLRISLQDKGLSDYGEKVKKIFSATKKRVLTSNYIEGDNK